MSNEPERHHRDAGSAETELEALVAFSRVASIAQTPMEILPHLADAALHVPGVQGVVLLQIAEDSGFDVAQSRGVALPPGRLSSDIAVLDERIEQRILAACASECAWARTIPLVSAGGLFGALVLTWPGDSPPSESALAFATALADMAAITLEKALQYDALAQQAADLRDSREELAKTETLRALGQMAAVVAHEVKNPLASIGGVIQVIRTRFPEDSRDRAVLGDVLKRLDGLDRMVNDMLVFARPRALSVRETSMRRVVTECERLFASDPAAEGVDVHVRGGEGVLRADPSQLQSVFSNLLLNAAQAIKTDGRIEIDIVEDGADVVVTVADTGAGIPEEARARVFEPFFTSKVRGTGLGLPTSRRIVEQHGGSIDVECPDVGGTVFTLRLPVKGPAEG